MTQLNWSFFGKYDSKNWYFWKKKDSKNWTLFFSMWLKELNSFLFDVFIWTFFQFDSKNCLFFEKITRRIEPSFWTCHNELNLFLKWRKELNITFLEYDSKNWTFSKVTHSIEFFFFLKMRLETIELCKYDSENWTFPFSIRLTELRTDVFFFFNLTQRIEYDSKHWTLFFNLTLRMEPSFQIWLTELNLSFSNMTHRNFWIKT